jgi:hypothetical protein
MVFDFAKAIEKVGEAIKSGFSYAEKAKEHQSETQIVKDKKRLKKATNIAQEAFRLIDDNKHYLPDDVVKKYEKLRKEFDEKD